MSDGPVIASSNRFDDISPYCGAVYASEPGKWKDVLPWEFPQHATRADEEAFLRTYFPESEIYSRGGADGEGLGFRFLKQVWYCIAKWNAEMKVPAIADEWIAQNQDVVGDASMLEHVCREGATVSTFAFTPEEVALYGEKMLGWAIQAIQYKARQLAETPTGSAMVSAEQLAPKATDAISVPATQINDANPSEPVPEVTQQPKASQSAVMPKVGLHAPDATANATNSVPNTAQTERFPDFSQKSAHPQGNGFFGGGEPAHMIQATPDHQTGSGYHADGEPMYVAQPSRPRGNSYKRGGNNNGSGRYNYNRPNSHYYSPQYQGSPQFNNAAPSIGNVPFHHMQNQNQMRMPSETMPPAHPMSSMTAVQQMQYPMQGGPLPPGAYGDHMQQPMTHQPYGPPFPPQQAQQMPMVPYGFASTPQQNQYFNNNPMNDRSNERYNNRSFSGSGPFEAAEQTSYSHRASKRRDSNVSRGNKSRPSYGGKSRGSRGRNSFTDSQMFNGEGNFKYSPRGQSRESQFPTDSYFVNGDRRGSMNGQSWDQNERPRPSMEENMKTGRNVSGRAFPTSGPMPSIAGGPPPGFEPATNRPYDRNNTWMPAPQQFAQPRTTDYVHDENDNRAKMHPGRLITEHSIGMECGHVTKLIVMDVPSTVTNAEVANLFSQCGKLEDLQRQKSTKYDLKLDNFFPIFENHFMARKALLLNRKARIGGADIKIAVPRVYWDPTHAYYPGTNQSQRWSHQRNRDMARESAAAPQDRDNHAPTLGNVTNQSIVATSTSADQGKHSSGNATPTAKAPISDKMLKDVLSGGSTPNASGTSTPKKKKGGGKTKNTKTLQSDVRGEAIQAAFTRHARAESIKSDVSTATVIRSSITPDDGNGSREGAATPVADESAETPQLAVDTEPKVPAVSDDVHTASEPQLSPTATTTGQLPKVSIPVGETVTETEGGKTDDAAGSKGLTQQPFRGSAETKEEAASSKAAGSKAESLTMATTKHAKKNDRAHLGVKSAEAPKVDRSTQPDASPSSQKSDQADDSFHTANGSPPGPVDRRREEACSSGESSVSTVIVVDGPMTPRATEKKGVEKNVTAKKPVKDDKQILATSPSPTKITKKAPVPLSPKVRIKEPTKSAKSAGDGGQIAQRTISGSGLSVPLTPAFQTAPSTPALPSDGEGDTETAKQLEQTSLIKTIEENAKIQESAKIEAATKAGEVATAKEAEKIAKAEKIAEVEKVAKAEKIAKAEKAKGPAQTESMSLFGKKQPKPKKAKPVKGSLRGKPKGVERSFSTATSESLSRVVSTQRDESPSLASTTQAGASGSLDVESSEGTKKKTADSGRGPQKDKSKKPTKAPAKAVSDAKDGIAAAVDNAAETTPSHSRSQSTSRGVAGFVSSFFRSGQVSQPSTPAAKVGESSSMPASADMNRQDSLPGFKTKHAAPAGPRMENAVGKATATLAAPAASVVSPTDDTGSTGQPFRGSHDFREGDECRDSGDSGGGSGAGSHADVGLGIDATGDAGVTAEAKGKRKRNKPKKNKKIVADGAVDPRAPIDPPAKAPESTASVRPAESFFQTPALPSPVGIFTFKGNQAVPDKPSDVQPPILDDDSDSSSLTLGRSCTEEASLPASDTAPDSPVRNSKIATTILQEISQGSPHLVQESRSRLKHANKRITFARDSKSASPPEEAGKASSGKAGSEEQVSDADAFDNMVDKSTDKKNSPVMFLYLGPGRRGTEADWEEKSVAKTHENLRKVVEWKTGSKDNAENVKPAAPSPRKG
ncbi:hypothetical protein LTR08_000619 [Meristemomyces frigidus]|nr:hypothetical protein LTR08_000619 [Meristemomyces frigidus]